MKDYYHILEVHPEASVEAIDSAYKVLARKYHPDRRPPEMEKWATLKMQEINEARDTLTNPVRRTRYVRQRRNQLLRLFWREGLAGLTRRRSNPYSR